MEKQLWVNIKKQIEKYYREKNNEEDLRIAKAFFQSGWNVYPESGYMFQKVKEYDDGSKNESCISIEEARQLSACLTREKKG